MALQDRDYAWGEGRRGLFGDGGPSRPWGLSGMSGWSVNTWIIVVNAIVFVLDTILQGRARYGPFDTWGHFSTTAAVEHLQVWRFITFQFLHADFWHILFNMLGLFWFGPMVEMFLGSRRYLAFYLLCGVAGALLYLVLNLLGTMFGNVPGLLPNDPATPLMGASAGVFGVLMAGAFLEPNRQITLLLFFVLPVTLRMKTLAYGLVAIALIAVYSGSQNAGGEAGHLGGALAGALLIRYASVLNFANLFPGGELKKRGRHAFDQFDHVFDRNRRSTSGGGAAPSGGERKGGVFGFGGGKSAEEDDREVDRILSKVATEGLHSLTERERKVLQGATERQRRRQQGR